MMKSFKLKKIAAGISVALLSGAVLTGCSSSSSSSSDEETAATAEEILSKSQEVILQNAKVAQAAYADSLDTAKELKTAIDAFVAAPDADTLAAAKTAWLVAREAYGPTEVYRFRSSPIDSYDYGADDDAGPEGAINAWPLGEALIDYTVDGTDFANGEEAVSSNDGVVEGGGAVTHGDDNIIGTVAAANMETTVEAYESVDGDERDVITGYHAIEFMLWGQDLNTTDQNANTKGDRANAVNATSAGGQRPVEDFTTDPKAAERKAYLQAVTNKLVADLQDVVDLWNDDATFKYYTEFTTAADQTTANEKLTEILTGMGKLSFGELASERMLVALRQDSQEDEHSCFSDNTHRDVVTNAQGVEIAYYGDYKGYDRNLDGVIDSDDGAGVARATSGAGFDELLDLVDAADVGDNFEDLLAATKTGYDAIDALARAGTPFDVQIDGLTETEIQASKVYETASALIDQGLYIQDEITEALDIEEDINSQDDATFDDADNEA